MKKTLLNLSLCGALLLANCGGKEGEKKEADKKETTEKAADKKDEPAGKEEGNKEEGNAKEGESKAVVTAKSGLAMRENPESKAKLVTLLPTNAIVNIVEKGESATLKGKKSNWYKVQYGKKEGWAFGAYLRLGDDVKATSNASVATEGDDVTKTSFDDVLQKGLVTAKSGLTLRNSGSATGKPVTVAPKNAEVGITEFGENTDVVNGLEGVWCKVRYGSKEGYVFSAYLCLSTATVTAKSGLSIRENPMTDQKLIKVIPFGKEVYLLPPTNFDEPDNIFQNEMGETWYKVRYGKFEGWASGEFLAMDMGC